MMRTLERPLSMVTLMPRGCGARGEGTVECMLVAMSVLALMGVR
jgi:hypothetical protein